MARARIRYIWTKSSIKRNHNNEENESIEKIKNKNEITYFGVVQHAFHLWRRFDGKNEIESV